MLRLGLAALAAGLAFGQHVSSRTDQEPCAAIASSLALQTSGPATLDATVAHACLRSVPLAKSNGTALLKAFKGMAEFQSNLAYLKNPPPGALYPAVDILGSLDDILTKLEADHYKNEFDFQYDIWSVVASAHDFHFNYNVDIMAIFAFKREQPLVSVSVDGIELPQIYLYSDLSSLKGSSENKPSPVAKINDIDVQTWLNNYASRTPFGHDPDANYNNVLWTARLKGQLADNTNGSFYETSRPQDPETKLTFANGTTQNLYTYASTGSDFKGVTDGASFFNKFCTGTAAVSNATSLPEAVDEVISASASAAASTATSATLNSFTAVPTQSAITPGSTNFPKPLVLVGDYSMAGYLPEDLPDTAVLQLASFGPADNLSSSYQNAVRGLLATAQSEGRKKLIVDLRGNGGGDVYLGYDTFRQIFPQILPYGGSTLRSPQLYRDIAEGLFDYVKQTPADQYIPEVKAAQNSVFIIPNSLDTNNQPFSSAQAQYGPFTIYNDNQTAIERTDLNNFVVTQPYQVYGFGNNTLPIPQAFQPNDIVLLQDGICGSTCAVFSEFMKSQGQVKTIAVGGRQQDGPMQGVGCTKGSQVIRLVDVASAFQASLKTANSSFALNINSSAADIQNGYAALSTRTPSSEGTGVRVNFRDNIREGDSTFTPLQHVYEAADCRIFYTAAQLEQQSLLWKTVHDIHWGNASCVPGSAGHPSSLSGALLSYINAYPPVGANYTFGGTEKAFPNGISNPASTISATGTPVAAATTGSSVLATGTTNIGTNPTSTASSAPSQTAKSWAPRTYHGCAGGLVAAAIALHVL